MHRYSLQTIRKAFLGRSSITSEIEYSFGVERSYYYVLLDRINADHEAVRVQIMAPECLLEVFCLRSMT
jgi:hypothetical protein